MESSESFHFAECDIENRSWAGFASRITENISELLFIAIVTFARICFVCLLCYELKTASTPCCLKTSPDRLCLELPPLIMTWQSLKQIHWFITFALFLHLSYNQRDSTWWEVLTCFHWKENCMKFASSWLPESRSVYLYSLTRLCEISLACPRFLISSLAFLFPLMKTSLYSFSLYTRWMATSLFLLVSSEAESDAMMKLAWSSLMISHCLVSPKLFYYCAFFDHQTYLLRTWIRKNFCSLRIFLFFSWKWNV